MIKQFNFTNIPKIIFGSGKLQELYKIIPDFGTNILFVIGKSSLKNSGKWKEITHNIEGKDFSFSHVSILGEPSPSIIDKITSELRNKSIDLIIGIGGGSVIDAGKAISAMLTKEESITNYLEGVGYKQHNGSKLPYIAIPTTSGTGSEATKNAVISQVGPHGFKKSLRHDNFVPNITIIDPELMITCPSSKTAACGMDAFTQLLETYVSSIANPITDALAFSGIKVMKDNLIPACTSGSNDINVRSGMAYGALMSGITLANAGLGIVHGLASPIGGFFDIPHGIVCGTLLSNATRINIERLKEIGQKGRKSLKKYAEIGALILNQYNVEEKKINHYLDTLLKTLDKWTKDLNIERLGSYGITENDIDKIIKNTSLKNNPVDLTARDIETIVINRL